MHHDTESAAKPEESASRTIIIESSSSTSSDTQRGRTHWAPSSPTQETPADTKVESQVPEPSPDDPSPTPEEPIVSSGPSIRRRKSSGIRSRFNKAYLLLVSSQETAIFVQPIASAPLHRPFLPTEVRDQLIGGRVQTGVRHNSHWYTMPAQSGGESKRSSISSRRNS